jgi:hypothetical protein
MITIQCDSLVVRVDGLRAVPSALKLPCAVFERHTRGCATHHKLLSLIYENQFSKLGEVQRINLCLRAARLTESLEERRITSQ